MDRSKMEQPDWLSLPKDLLALIAQRSRNAVTGLATFRSVCRTWRAVVGPAPRLLLPRRRANPYLSDDPADYTLVFPLSRGWCIVADARDTSCHLSHLATGRTAALPKLSATYNAGGAVEHLGYVYRAWKVSEPGLLSFMDCLSFAVHIPPVGDNATVAGMTILMHHMNRPGSMVFCRPGDRAWTNVEKRWRTTAPTVGDFLHFAYHDGKMFRMDVHGETVVFDAAALDVIHRVPCPPLISFTPNISGNDYDFIHLIALQNKLVLIETSTVCCRPVAFHIFELVISNNTPPDDAGRLLAWVKVADAGNYELFLDSYHATFKENIGNGAHRGTRIYYVHDDQGPDGMSFCPPAAYCYSVHDNKVECVYRLPPEDSSSRADEYATRPSWFVP